MTFHDKNRGFTLIEAILGLAIFVLIVSGLASALIYAWRSGAVAGDRQRAVFYAAEGLEATRNIRDASFANLVDGVYGLAVSANVWTFSGSSDSTGIFQRQISISTVDANTKQIT